MTTETTGPLAVDRRAQVLDLLQRTGSARVSDLTEALGVTAVTVRRDIAHLAEAGLVRRVHGGVTLLGAAEPVTSGEEGGGERAAPRPHGPVDPERAAAGTPVAAGGPGAVGMLVPSLDYYWPGVARGVEAAARTRGLGIVLRGSSYESDDDRPQLERLVQQVGAGGLVAAPRTDIPTAAATLAWLAGTGIPTVLAERSAATGPQHAAFDSVLSDHAEGAEAAVRHLVDLGHTRVGLVVSGHSPTGPHLRRGWLEATAGLTRTLDVATPDPGRPGWDEAVAHVVDACLSTRTTALLVHADATAVALVQALEQHGVEVPRRLSVVAYDDEVAGLFSPALTAVRPHRHALGRAAVELLAARIAEPGRPTHRVLITPSLRVRESTAPPAP
ncbi:DeoR family transcriptional regulator [Cellulomonas hominis]|uniref:DeoR family transcriptional regulator n=1 Tax=Cellulomonas hominis TaxID=156981 RepID=A0A7Z8NP36_9CELL|nr:substrate-binding domain-containing protein [Cellulomonas hominis]TKR23315.1 DeoR family transcriptional regulator [Cellulomonas hominis]